MSEAALPSVTTLTVVTGAVTFYFASSKRIRGHYVRGSGSGEINYGPLAIQNMEINLLDATNGLFCTASDLPGKVSQTRR